MKLEKYKLLYVQEVQEIPDLTGNQFLISICICS